MKATGIKKVAAKILPAKAAPKKAAAPKKKPAQKSTLAKIAAAIVEPIKEIPAAVASIPEKISEGGSSALAAGSAIRLTRSGVTPFASDLFGPTSTTALSRHVLLQRHR